MSITLGLMTAVENPPANEFSGLSAPIVCLASGAKGYRLQGNPVDPLARRVRRRSTRLARSWEWRAVTRSSLTCPGGVCCLPLGIAQGPAFGLRVSGGKTYNPLVTTTSKPRRRWFQYSLRTLLVLMLLVCIGTGWIAMKLQQVRRERAAVAAIERLGGEVGTWSRPNAWLRKLLGDNFFVHPVYVAFENDASMEYLHELPQLERLHAGSQVTDAGLAHLKHVPQLRHLYIAGSQITDAGLEHLKGLAQLKTCPS